MKPTLTVVRFRRAVSFGSALAVLSRARPGRFLAVSGLWLTMCADSFALIPPHGKYRENTETVPVAKTLTGGGIRMKIENTIRLTPAPISAMHPFLKAIRLNNGERALLIYSHNHRHPDTKEAFADGNRYGAKLIGTFVSFTEDER